MRTVQTRNGPFAERPHYEISEIELICTDALKSTDLLPESPKPVRIDRFVEKYFNVTPSYQSLPEGILGYTEFGSDGVKAIIVTTALDEDGGNVSERRVRTTLAHEAGHGLLHMHLFALGEKPCQLFEDSSNQPKILCRDVQGETLGLSSYDGRWWEYQANRAIGGLLLPRRIFSKAVEPFCEAKGGLGLPRVRESFREFVVKELAETFNVNPVVVRIRLNELFPAEKTGQRSL